MLEDVSGENDRFTLELAALWASQISPQFIPEPATERVRR